MTPTTTAANTQTTPESDTECEEIHEEDEENMDSDNSDSDTPKLDFGNSNSEDPIAPDDFSQSQEEEDDDPIYDSDGNKIVPGHQLF